MTYYPTLDEDLARAREILAKGKADPIEELPPTLRAALETGGTIYGGDVYAAYKLLESFVAEIERLRATPPAPPAVIIPPYGSEVLCEACAHVFCPHGEPLHFHHDGCPACCPWLTTGQAAEAPAVIREAPMGIPPQELAQLRDDAESFQLLIALMGVTDYKAAVRALGTLREQNHRVIKEREQLHAEVERLRATLGRVEQLIDIALPRFNWGASALDAEAIALLNEVPAEVKRVLYG